ncbi:MAG: TAT-variant-translocated molybdopterin oxidoreductase [Myxococcaceae bacterium]|nr:TAT-variant-translocated molybdopterin oxidoreductase [Myxococcaceae bacterium]MCA3014313.1 TAT-variant-translocated molybdopterin oxidoreductase [Myxococcaceae bacterium]
MKKDPYAPIREQMNEPPQYWRSIAQKEGDETLKEAMEREFPNGLTPPDGFNRRDALKLGAAAMSLGALAGCDNLQIRRPVDEIHPFVKQPEQMVPGVRMYYATAVQRSEGALGLIVEQNAGRPTKIEGNPNHPSSLGASDTWAQAEVLRLYDPERARSPRKGTTAAKWEEFDAVLKDVATRFAGTQGAGLALVVEDELGPTAERLLEAIATKLPQARVVRWDPLAPDHQHLGAHLAFGAGARVHYDLKDTKVIFGLDSDFLAAGPDHLKLARQFGTSRAVHTRDDVAKMKRLYVAESVFSITGTNADHRLRVASSQGVEVMKALAKALVANGVDAGLGGFEPGPLPEPAAKFVAALAKDLAANKGAATLFVGERQPPAVHAMAYAINVALGGPSMTVSTGKPVEHTTMYEQLAALTKALNEGAVDTLVLVDVNPVYTAPGALKFGEALAKAKTSIHVGVFAEETGAKTTWHAPLAHFLESWGDAEAWDGTASLVQPLILPLFSGRPLVSVLAALAGEAETNDRKLVEATWRAPGKPLEGEKAWRKALHDGVIPGTSRSPAAASAKTPDIFTAVGALKSVAPGKDSYELVAVHGHAKDGRLTNVSWIMELPDSMSKLAWDNAVCVSPALAKELGIGSKVSRNGYEADVVELTAGGRSIKAPAFVLPGLSATTAVMTIGYGREQGEVAKGVGADIGPLLDNGLNVVTGVKIAKTGATQTLCSTQDHFSVPASPLKELTFVGMLDEPKDSPHRELGLKDRPLFRSANATQYEKDVNFARKGDIPANLVKLGTPKDKQKPSKPFQPTDEIVYEGQQWGMVIDLSACIGCNFCSIACQAENNIPVVGREQVMLGREMHWIRIDRYFTGDVDAPTAIHQPVACMHCENAPCEPVCPVSATVHDEEGTNTMAYNRCIGTRYCANNCPYKVRRFNYLDYTHTGNVYVEPYWKERMKTLKLQRNPDVSVRYRGVMEKCSYCTQRIEEAKISTKRKGGDRKALPDGAVVTACQQACPTQAITFGNINDEKSKVHALKVSERNYEMLQELNVRPRTSYLARVRNENEELA